MSLTEPRLSENHREYRFGDYVLDVHHGFLRHRGQEVALQPKPFEVLTYLIERPGRVVNKEELIEAVWGETAVTDNSLSQCIVQIRRALADDSQLIIRTLARRGYVFLAPLTAPVRELPSVTNFHITPDSNPPPAASKRRRLLAAAGIFVLALVVFGLAFRLLNTRRRSDPVFTQITNFPDSAAGPVLSRDGRMVAFFRSDSAFAAAGPIYVKMLPDGEATQITADIRNKYGLAFSPDATRITYTVWDNNGKFQWQTFSVPSVGGTPELLFANAAGLTWLDKGHFLYSEIRSGLHMGVVTSKLNRTDRREIYFPEHERRMAHYSYVSPDRKWILVAEMDPEWLPCRLVPFNGNSPDREVGPPGRCASAGWSPDGKWMYFGVEVDGAHHLWRQRFPHGNPEQITFGPAEEEGIAVTPDGRSLITSLGIRQSAVWLHDGRGVRPISPEGYAAANYLLLTAPLFSFDGRYLYYLLSPKAAEVSNEIWRTNISTGASECVVRGFSILEFDISDGPQGFGEVVFSSQRPGEQSQLWLAPLDGSAPPKRLTDSGEGSPHFGPNGRISFCYSDGKDNYLGQMNRDGSGRRKLSARPISTLMSSSPGGRWLVAMAPGTDRAGIDTIAIAAVNGESHLIGRGRLPVSWTRDGRFVYIGLENGNLRHSVSVPVLPGDLPDLPPHGITSLDQVAAIRGARLIDGIDISPGPNPSTFAYVKSSIHRNLYRVSLP